MDLLAEFSAAQDRIKVQHCRWLKDRGVGQLGLFLEGGGFAFGIAEIEIQSDDSWMPMPGGREAMILYDENEDGVDDLFAFFPKNPSRLFRRTNALRYLGCEHLYYARVLDEPLYLRATAVDWLVHGRTGTVIVDWDPLALIMDLRGLVEIRADNEALGAKLHKAMTQPFPCPPILVAS